MAKGLPLTFSGILGPEKAIVSSGGVGPDQIQFQNMELKAFPGLHVVGDLIDFNRPSGGCSLQICWATGWVAGS